MHIPNSISLKGQLLLAMPGLVDPNFFRSVSCICEHTAEGALGISINRIHPALSCKDIFEALDIDYCTQSSSLPVHLGGPVHVDEIFVLHGPPFDWEGCLVVMPSVLALSNTMDIIEAIAMDKGPKSVLIALGCAGWGAGQLENELGENAWLTCEVTKELLFDLPFEKRWEAAIKTMGVDPVLLSDSAGHA